MFKKQNMDIQVNLRKLFVCGYIEVSPEVESNELHLLALL